MATAPIRLQVRVRRDTGTLPPGNHTFICLSVQNGLMFGRCDDGRRVFLPRDAVDIVAESPVVPGPNLNGRPRPPIRPVRYP